MTANRFSRWLSGGIISTVLVMNAQEVGIGTTSPTARLHIEVPASYTSDLIRGDFGGKTYFLVDDQGNLVSAVENTDATASAGPPPVSGAGRRMLWYSEKAAFRAGYVNGTQWDQSQVGIYSAAFGDNNEVSGQSAFASGSGNTVSGNQSIAFGSSNTVGNGMAMGSNNNLSSTYQMSVAIGSSNALGGHFLWGSFAIGASNDLDRSGSMAIGMNNRTYQNGATSNHYFNLDPAITIGAECTVTTARSIVIGYQSKAYNVLPDATNGLEVVVIGSMSQSAGYQSVIIGKGCYGDKDATGAVTLGYTAKVYGNKSTAVGFEAQAYGTQAVAISVANTKAYGNNSVAIGHYAKTENTAAHGTAIGYYSLVQGEKGMSLGVDNIARAYQVVLGTWNEPLGSNSGWTPSEPVFIVGNGSSSLSRSNAMVVLKNGNVGFGMNSPTATVHVKDVLRLEPSSTPTSPSAGDIYFDSGTNKLRCYDGTTWHDLW